MFAMAKKSNKKWMTDDELTKYRTAHVLYVGVFVTDKDRTVNGRAIQRTLCGIKKEGARTLYVEKSLFRAQKKPPCHTGFMCGCCRTTNHTPVGVKMKDSNNNTVGLIQTATNTSNLD